MRDLLILLVHLIATLARLMAPAVCGLCRRRVAPFYNVHRAHASLEGRTPVATRRAVARLGRYGWQAHCRGLYQTPIAA